MKRVRVPCTILAVAGLLVLAPLAARGADTAAQAKAMIEAKSGSTVAGTATFTELANGVKVVVHIEQASPRTQPGTGATAERVGFSHR